MTGEGNIKKILESKPGRGRKKEDPD